MARVCIAGSLEVTLGLLELLGVLESCGGGHVTNMTCHTYLLFEDLVLLADALDQDVQLAQICRSLQLVVEVVAYSDVAVCWGLHGPSLGNVRLDVCGLIRGVSAKGRFRIRRGGQPSDPLS